MEPRVNVGCAYRRGANVGLMALGLIMITIGLAVAFKVDTIAPILSGSITAVLILMALFVGILMVIYSLRGEVDADLVYLDDGRCGIVNTLCSCSGGCKTCVFAMKYLEIVNEPPEMPEPKN